MPKTKSNSEKQVDSIKRYIVKLLKEAGAYDATLIYQIELVATDILLYRRIREALFDDEKNKMSVNEKSREGNKRLKPNPMIFQLREQSKVVAKNLDALLMNVKSKKGAKKAANSLAEFMKAMSESEE